MASWTQKTLSAYLAAFIDSDGSIGIYKNGNRANSFRLRITIFNNNPAVLRFIKREFGGTIHCRKPCVNRLAKSLQYTLVWQAKAGEIVLRRVLPYMMVKRRQGELMLKFRERQRAEGFNGHIDKSWQAKFAKKMRKLNSQHRGGN